ncbi:hypothetical protein G6F56_011039 [Rhizopus delemar]|nr:hypothetical protein G6F56_011039 [Rhizopus delemar]
MFNSGGTAPFNSSPRTSPSVANYSLSMYGMPTATTNTTASTSTNTTNSITTTTTTTGNANANSFGARFSQSQTLLGGTDGTTTPHLARQLTYAQISRQSSSPHHHARAAAAMARNTPVSSAVTITDPNDPTKFANGHGTFKTKKTVVRTGEENQSWTLLDMGGMGLKNVSPAVCNYTFLTALYMNHNNLTYLMPALAQLTQLRILDISGNKLTMLPPELGMLIQLRELLAFDNNLVTLPTEFGCYYVS